MTPVERIRRQFQDAIEDLEKRSPLDLKKQSALEHLRSNLTALSLKELGQLLKSPAARCVADVPATMLLGDGAARRT